VHQIELILNGFAIALSGPNIVACFTGALLGTIVGVLPGLGPTATMSLLLPVTATMEPVTGIIMLSGIWYGANYGGSTTSILVNIPGEASSVMTAIDGYQMAKNGRAGAALSIAAIGSFIAGTVGVMGLQVFAPPLAKAALAFGPPEYFALMIFAFVILSNLTEASPVRGFAMAFLGLTLGAVGMDPVTAVNRLTFSSVEMMDGIDFMPIAMGLFGISEILSVAVEKYVVPVAGKIRARDLYLNRDELRRSVPPILRGSILGFFIGLIPGPGPTISTFVSYSLEKRLSKRKEEFGKGAIEGVAGPESANNAAVSGSLIPLLALGLPFAPPAAVLLSGLRMQNITTGPLLMTEAPTLFWGVVASMYIGNIMLLILNLPLVGVFARLAELRSYYMMPIVSVLCVIGVYSVRGSFFDIYVMIAAGVFGLVLKRLKYPIAPLIIGLILGPTAEMSLRKSLVLLDGNLLAMFARPISATLLVLTVTFVAWSIVNRRLVKKSLMEAATDV
jgi:putative tricarboxylic transport membrane protein